MPPRIPGASKPSGSTSKRTSPRATSENSEARIREILGDVPSNEPDTASEEIPDLTPSPLTRKEIELASDIAGVYAIVGVMMGLVSRDIATNIMTYSDEAAYQWVLLARRNPKVRNALMSFTTTTVWAKVIATHLKMVSPGIAIPFGIPNIPTQGPQEGSVQSSEFDLVAFMQGMSSADQQSAAEMAMDMMRGQAPEGSGGPTDTVTVSDNVITPEGVVVAVDANGHPMGSAEYQPPPMNPDEYPFPARPPANGSAAPRGN